MTLRLPLIAGSILLATVAPLLAACGEGEAKKATTSAEASPSHTASASSSPDSQATSAASAERPAVATLVDSLMKGTPKPTKESATCVAKALHESKLSDEYLVATLTPDKPFDATDADLEIYMTLLGAVQQKCPSGSPSPSAE